MSRVIRRVALVVAGAAVVTWVVVTSIPSESGYRDTALSAAHDGLSAVRTLELLSSAHVLSTYRSVAADDAVTKLTDATRQLESADVPGPSSAALRDRLAPVLAAAVDSATDMRTAMDQSDPGKVTGAVGPLRTAGDELDAFLRSNQ
jgi:hypothetical protein